MSIFGNQQNASTNAGSSGGFNFGGAQQQKPTGLAFPTPASTTSATATPLSLGATKPRGLTFGGVTTLGATTTASSLSGLLSQKTTTSAPTGLTLTTATQAPATGFSLTTTTTASGSTLGGSTGFSFGSGGGFGGGLGGTSTTKPTLSFGGTTTTSSLGQPAVTTATGIFGGTDTSQTASRGLGGVDPKTSVTGSVTGSAGKVGDSKLVKESVVPAQIMATIESFEKHVKEQKNTCEHIARSSSKPLYKVQEDIQSLRQMLSAVKNGLHRNASAVDKLKKESTQELKYAEIAQRTKDTPPGLQYENTAPNLYFSRLLDDFEQQMVNYRQQIEEMENHLTSLNTCNQLTPPELSGILRKMYESFVALAAQLQATHNAVKVQKDQFLNYRRVFHNDATDVFEKRKRLQDATGCSVVTSLTGPSPFKAGSNEVATAMATALNRPQQTAPVPGVASLAQTSTAPGFGIGTGVGFGAGVSNTATVAPIGFGSTGGGLFGSTAGTGTGLNLGSANTSFGVQPQTQGFQLGKPPAGNKRGKKS